MKKTLWLALILLLVCVFAFSACDSGDTPPTNNENNQQTTDNNNQNTESGENQTNGNGNNTSNMPTECQHAFGNWDTVKQATCKEEGKLVRTCTKCFKTEESTVSKTDVHTEVIDTAVTATCTVDGKTEGKHCSVCGKTIIAQTVVKASGHTEVVDPAVEATCKAKGKTEGKHCSVCNTVIIKQTDTAIIDHDYQSGACTMCKAVDTVAKQAEIDAENERHEAKLAQIEEYYPSVISGLQERINNLKDAYGITYVYSDSYCYDKISSLTTEIRNLERKIASLSGSTNSSDVAERRRYEAQLTQKQNEQDIYYKCITINGLNDEITYTRAYYSEAISDENATHEANLETIEIKYACASNGHTVVIDKAIDPTCTVSGRTEGSHCSVCNVVLVVTQTISATGHNYGDWNIVLNPTCEDKGTEERTCSTCNTKEQNSLPALGHNWGEWSLYVTATCTEGGQEKRGCTRCTTTDYQSTDATGHNWGEWSLYVTATCTEGGQEKRECTRCTTTDYQSTNATGHNWGSWEANVPSTCLYEGNLVKHCANCEYSEYKSAPLADHQYDNFDICQVCNMLKASDGLSYALTNNGDAYYVSSIGTCLEKDIVIAKYYFGKPVVSIGKNAFSNSNITSIVVPDSILNIQEKAFLNCSQLESISLPDTIVSIENNAFQNCSSLKSVTLPENIECICAYTFAGCSNLAQIDLSENLIKIEDYAFLDCTKLFEIEIPNSVNKIGKNVFNNCMALTKITLPFLGKSEVDSTSKFLGYLFGSQSNEENSSYVPDSLKEVVITKEYRIENNAFKNCSSIIRIELSNTIKFIAEGAFSGCSSLQEIVLPFVGDGTNTANNGSKYPLGYIFGTAKYEGGVGTNQTYETNSYKTMKTYYLPSSLHSVEVLGGNIYLGAFGNCKTITTVMLGNEVISIASYAFEDCTGLTNITIPDSVTSIGSYAFRRCSGLTSVTFGQNSRLTKVGSLVFEGCRGLRKISIPNSVTSIGYCAFVDCSVLADVYYKGTAEQWGEVTIDTGNTYISNATRYYYSETPPEAEGNYWHYVDGVPTSW